MDDWLSVKNVAALYGVQSCAVCRWCREGKLPGARWEGWPSHHIWKIPPSALIGFVPPRGGRPRKLSINADA